MALAALAKRLFTEAAEHREPLPEGYAFRFQAEMFEAIAKFVANERKCCPFIQFEISLSQSSDPIWLRMSGPEGTRAAIDAELSPSKPISTNCGCGK